MIGIIWHVFRFPSENSLSGNFHVNAEQVNTDTDKIVWIGTANQCQPFPFAVLAKFGEFLEVCDDFA
jgi:hypothetical protein